MAHFWRSDSSLHGTSPGRLVLSAQNAPWRSMLPPPAVLCCSCGWEATGEPWEIAKAASEARPAAKLQDVTARQLDQFRQPKDTSDTLLGNRYLCRGGGLLLVGPSGIGKSALSMQSMILWALGLPCFDIKPAKPLKSLLIQAENDDGDLAEMSPSARNAPLS